MSSDEQKSGPRRFFVKQMILLAITIILVAFFTVPLLRAVKATLNPGEIEAKADKINKEVAGLQTKIDITRSKILMGAGDEKAQEKLKKEVEELKRKVAATELEKKQLQDQMLILTMQQMMKAKSSDTAPPPVEFWTKVVELMIKVIGAIGSVFSGLMFVVSWLRKRGGLPGGTAG